ncbi:MAG: ATP-dependent DNA helicase PcrA, DNA helicase II / ATP-dependent DNA helicase PcrA [Candidatus Peregrinibacteria bacterium GW2011_GWF2_38_29]|nr:MAG: ATP-dependent DNA helicase PcrA, DNA helicase II / ATP-dependent DNA helicase PcrA [Candidatus Peregrinibacteria bacterium GW2011_GWF2_38_29]HBB02850.1 ATP-dependent DNA helicase PcrA [Candidatus Peregrinibacteria bacterium]
MDNILENLNKEQKEAVMHIDGPMCVLAGAGSGKTRVLTHRIAYMIGAGKISPNSILAVTFTNKAAEEMKKRLAKLLGKATYSRHESADMPTVGTFHSICLRILRQHAHMIEFEDSFVVYDESDQQILMKNIMREKGVDEHKIIPRSVLSEISNAKNQLLGPDAYHDFVDSTFSEAVADLYPSYQSALHKNQAMDFDDLIMKTVELFQKQPDLLNYYQEKWKYISADEYQDTNKAQYVLLNLLANKYKNIAVIGDDDQSIYSWRGATVQNILDFEKDYPDAKIVKLEQNYRSTKQILDTAHSVISKNKKRKEKKLWTERADGEKIRIWRALNGMHEAELIAEEILSRLQAYEDPRYNDFVVLYRTHAQSRVIEEVLLKFGIPYKIIGGIKFYSRKEIKDIVAYLRVITNPSDTVSLMRIINVPPRNIGAKTIEALQNFSVQNDVTAFEAIKMVANSGEESGSSMGVNGGIDIPTAKKESLKNFIKGIERLQKINSENSAAGVIKHVIEDSGYKKFIDDNTAEGEAALENVRELISVAKKYDSLESGMSLRVFLEEISLIAEADNLDERENSVTMMTVHGAKGLEFPYVFIAGMEDGIFPHVRSLIEAGELEEERRLMYVACTRAKEVLYLLFAQERLLYGDYKSNAPSQFLEYLDEVLVEKNYIPENSMFSRERESEGIAEQYFGSTSDEFSAGFSMDRKAFKPVPVERVEEGSEFKDGDKINHATFGKGIVLNVIGGVATVAFEDPRIGVKKLAISVAPMRKI